MSNQMARGIKYKIFDKTTSITTGVYGLHRFNDEAQSHIIQNNYRAIVHTLEADQLLIMNHVHGNTVIDADKVEDFSIEPEADAAVTTRKKVILTSLTADCVPVLLASDDAKVIGSAHCGWRSAKLNILTNVINMIRDKSPAPITVLIGPAIQQDSYEVDQPFYQEILSSEPESIHLFKKSSHNNKWLFDLPGFVILKLNHLGITQINNLNENTFTQPEKYYSYRYDLKQGIKNNFNILSAISLLA